jgi:hypothetical protein
MRLRETGTGEIAEYEHSNETRLRRFRSSEAYGQAYVFIDARSHRQNHSELRFAAQHPCVRLTRFFERIRFSHGTHAAQFGEA